MGKRAETITIEKVLQRSCFGQNPALAKEYGTTEVTLIRYGMQAGKEIVDFLSYDPLKDIFRCYEIKVTMHDFHSNAKMSWYGNFNYLVTSKDLYEQQPLDDWRMEIPFHVGFIVVDTNTKKMEIIKKPQNQYITSDTKEWLKNALLRTLFYQNNNDNWYLRRSLAECDKRTEISIIDGIRKCLIRHAVAESTEEDLTQSDWFREFKQWLDAQEDRLMWHHIDIN